MSPGNRYAIAILLSVLLAGSLFMVYRAGEVAGESRGVPIVIRTVAPAPTPQPSPSAPVAASPALDAPVDVPVPDDSIPTPKASHRHRSRGHAKAGKLRSPGDGTVDINTASAEELQRLPGVGPKMANKIIDYRMQVGDFRSASDLTNVGGIGDKKLAKMEPFLRF